MATVIEGSYEGNKRVRLKHELSGAEFVTDAPLDNNGEGRSFSPTDLVGASLASCILTILAIKAEKMGIADFEQGTFKVEKEMAPDPRRIAKLTVEMHLPSAISAEHRESLEKAVEAVPVDRSLHPDMELNVTYSYDL